MPSSKISAEAQEALDEWVRRGYYVYLRPINSKLIDSSKEQITYWNVIVELRNPHYQRHTSEGPNLSKAILALHEIFPKKAKPADMDKLKDQPGWGVPEELLEKAVKRAKKRRKKK